MYLSLNFIQIYVKFFFHMMFFVRVCVEDKFTLIVHMNKGF